MIGPDSRLRATRLSEAQSQSFPVSFSGEARRWIWLNGQMARHPFTAYALIVVVAIYGFLLRFAGLGKSLWLDEAWVANSVVAPTPPRMFYYDSWLQTSPPLFLMLVRDTVQIVGVSNSSLRAIPLLMGIVSAVSMIFLAKHFLSRQYALLASAMFALSPLAIEYSRTLKQYSSELAATTTILLFSLMYLERATLKRFWLLVGAVVAGLLLAYPVAFLLPGAILAVLWASVESRFTQSRPTALQSSRLVRAVVFAVAAGGTLVSEYAVFVVPNVSPLLRTLWALHHGSNGFIRIVASDCRELLMALPLPGRVMEIVGLFRGAGVLLAAGLALAYVRFRNGRRKWLEVQTFCLLPCVLAILADSFSWYPLAGRTGLFLLPFIVILLVSSFQLTCTFVMSRMRRDWLTATVQIFLVIVTILVIRAGVRSSTPIAHNRRPIEDSAGSTSFLREQVSSNDILWVHSSASEGFKLYARMIGWNDAPSRYGHTGWPCCPRGVPNMKGTSTEDAVRNDMRNGISDTFAGRVWLLYTTRSEHWQFVGLDEPKAMKAFLTQRGCSEELTQWFVNIGISCFDCRKGNDRWHQRNDLYVEE